MIKTCSICGKQFDKKYAGKYCCDECRKEARHLYNQKYMQKQKQIYNKTCPVCGTEFTTTRSYKKYCSEECNQKVAQKLRADIFKRKHITQYAICPICGKQFPQTKHHMKYCSIECKNVAKQRKIKPEYVEKNCIICGKPFLTKHRSTLCCSDICHRKYRVIVQTAYMKKKTEAKKEEKLKLKAENAEKERQLALQQQFKQKKKREEKIQTIQEKIEFPLYMKKEILEYISEHKYSTVLLFVENRLLRKFNFIGDIDKDKVYTILSQSSDNVIQQLEDYLVQVVCAHDGL